MRAYQEGREGKKDVRLLLDVLADVNLLDFVGESVAFVNTVAIEALWEVKNGGRVNIPKLLQSNGDLYSIGSLSCIQCDIRARHDGRCRKGSIKTSRCRYWEWLGMTVKIADGEVRRAAFI